MTSLRGWAPGRRNDLNIPSFPVPCHFRVVRVDSALLCRAPVSACDAAEGASWRASSQSLPWASWQRDCSDQKASMATKILIVEDNSDLADLLSLYLRCEGFETLQAINSSQGISKALVERPDLVITDLHLPDMTAVEAAIILKQDPMTSTIPIIVLTATTVREWRNKALDAGVAEYLIKPISPTDLAKAVRKFIQAPSLLIEH